MANAIILDILLVLIVLLSMPLGFWRGVNREVFVSAAILHGMAVAATWNDRWGERLADWLLLGHATARFLVAIGIILGSTLVVGYAGGALAASGSVVGPWARLSGAALAAANATVLLALALHYIQQDLGTTYSLDVIQDGLIARFLTRHFDWVVLGLGAAWLVTVIGGWIAVVIFSPRGDLPVVETVPPPDRGESSRDRRRAVRLPKDPEGGKFEPDARLASEAPSIVRSTPIGTVDPARWSSDRTSPAWSPAPWRTSPPADSPNGETGRRLGGREWVRRSSSGDDAESPAKDGGQRSRRCERCGQEIGSDDIYCPRCGRGMTS
jgi:uncharacterized membrane protein required for colicin V production